MYKITNVAIAAHAAEGLVIGRNALFATSPLRSKFPGGKVPVLKLAQPALLPAKHCAW